MKVNLPCLLLLTCLSTIAVSADTTDTTQPKYQTPPTQYYLSDKLFEDNELKEWLKTSLTNTFTLTPSDYQNQLANDREYFTSAGYESLLSLLDEQKLLDTVVTKDVKLTCYIDDPLEIIEQKIIAHKYSWTITTTLSLFFQSESQAYSEALPISITVTRATPNTGVGVLIANVSTI